MSSLCDAGHLKKTRLFEMSSTLLNRQRSSSASDEDSLTLEGDVLGQTITEYLQGVLSPEESRETQDLAFIKNCTNVRKGDVIHVNTPIEMKTVIKNMTRGERRNAQGTSESGLRKNEGPHINSGRVQRNGKCSFVTRSEWDAEPPIRTTPLSSQVPYVILHHTCSERYDIPAENISQVQDLQDCHMGRRELDDIAYNFMIGGDGNVYEGRGWDVTGQHASGFDEISVSIAFIGTHTAVPPIKSQLMSAFSLIQTGVRRGRISKDYKMLSHCQVCPSKSPENAVINAVKLWPHWSPEGDYYKKD